MSRNRPTDYVLDWMRANNVPLTRENYVHINSMGQISPDELDGEAEADLPREIIAAEIRKIRRDDQRFLRSIGVGYGGRRVR